MVKLGNFRYVQTSWNDRRPLPRRLERLRRSKEVSEFHSDRFRWKYIKFSNFHMLTFNHYSTGVPLAVPLQKKFKLVKDQILYKTVWIMLTNVSETFQEKIIYQSTSVLKYLSSWGPRVDDTEDIIRNRVFLKTTLSQDLVFPRSILGVGGHLRTLCSLARAHGANAPISSRSSAL